MKVLVVGSGPESRALAACLSQGVDLEVTHCSSGGTAIAAVEAERQRYEWMFVESHPQGAQGEHIARCLHRAAGGAPISLLYSLPLTESSCSEDLAPCTEPPLVCGIERTESGLQLMRCALQRAQLKSDADPALRDVLRARSLVFEYHAPCKKLR